MVKPPKTMQPEAVDLSKAGRKSGRAFQKDSFHQYMARKIDLQRKQFGLIIPPAPVTPKKSALKTSALRAKSPGTPSRAVRFDPLPQDETCGQKNSSTGMCSIIDRLQQRHGPGRKRTGSRGRKRKLPLLTGEDSGNQLEEELRQETQHSPTASGKEEHLSSQQQSPSPTSFISSPRTPSLRHQRPDLFFLGIVVKVNGYTDPDNETLKRMLQKHGGDFETYETERVTHMVAEHISTAKANYMKKQRRPRPVCRPSWIVDSVHAGKLLPHGHYLLEELKDHSNGAQTGIAGLLGKTMDDSHSDTDEVPRPKCDAKATPAVTDSESSPLCNADPEAMLETSEKAISSDLAPVSSPCGDTDIPESDQFESFPDQLTEKTCTNEEGIENSPSHIIPVNGAPSAGKEDAIVGKTDTKYINGKLRTTGTDPNYLNSFFASSRLSFIGSFKQRTPETALCSFNKQDLAARNMKRFIFHVDMDCFFANVVLRNFPQFRDKPVVISHHGQGASDASDTLRFKGSRSTKGSTSECATCNYKAREYGIKKGMFLGRARELCPDLVVLPYDFKGYEEVSEQVLEILHRVAAEHGAANVEVVSCDEAYMEMFFPDNEDSLDQVARLAEATRSEIFDTTQCTASIGVANNKFLAKLGTDRCKPNGSYIVTDHRTLLEKLRLRDLHGIGYRSEPRLAKEGLRTVQDIWDLGSNAETVLSRVLGPGLGKKTVLFCQGVDSRAVKPAERKTIGAECSYGVRFDGPYGPSHLIGELAKEVQKRMEAVGVVAQRLTLKMKQRKEGARLPAKFLGHGPCHNVSKGLDFPGSLATCDAGSIADLGMTLFKEMNVPLEDVRGMGMVLSKLSSVTGESEGRSKSSRGGLSQWIRNEEVPEVPERKGVSSHSSRQSDKCQIVNGADSMTEETPTGMTCNFPPACEKEENGKTDKVVAIREDSTSPRDHSEPQPYSQIALPPLSQLHMSQVLALPTDLQEQIRSKIQDQAGTSTAPVNDLFSTANGGHLPQSPTNNTGEHASNVRIDGFGRPGSQVDTTLVGADSEHRFRQTDLKRMMRLAAVRSGQEKRGISLTQLENLPLEIKLQVVNEDVDPLGSLPPRTTRAPLQESASKSIKIQDVEDCSDTAKAETAIVEDVTLDSASRPQSQPKEASTASKMVTQGPSNLYEEDILPLKVFLDENEPHCIDAIHSVAEFLTICLNEGRLKDIVTLIRSIRRRRDKWSRRDVLSEIVHRVNDEHIRLHGSGLDVEWLVGT